MASRIIEDLYGYYKVADKKYYKKHSERPCPTGGGLTGISTKMNFLNTIGL